jgi:hypothetical protein
MVRTLVALLALLVLAHPVRALVLDDFATAQSLTLQWDGLASDETPNQTPGSFAAPFRQLQMTFSQYATGDVVRLGAGSGIGAVEKIAGGTNQVFVESARFVYQGEDVATLAAPPGSSHPREPTRNRRLQARNSCGRTCLRANGNCSARHGSQIAF